MSESWIDQRVGMAVLIIISFALTRTCMISEKRIGSHDGVLDSEVVRC